VRSEIDTQDACYLEINFECPDLETSKVKLNLHRLAYLRRLAFILSIAEGLFEDVYPRC